MTPKGTTERPKITAEESVHLLALFDAWRKLTLLGWQEPKYFQFPPEGEEFELIELGSTGIHRAIARGFDPKKTCWVDYEWPAQPFLVRKVKDVR